MHRVTRLLQPPRGTQVVHPPFSAISEHADVTLSKCRAALLDVASELVNSLRAYVADPQVLLDLDDRVAGLDVDAAAFAGWRLEID